MLGKFPLSKKCIFLMISSYLSESKRRYSEVVVDIVICGGFFNETGAARLKFFKFSLHRIICVLRNLEYY